MNRTRSLFRNGLTLRWFHSGCSGGGTCEGGGSGSGEVASGAAEWDGAGGREAGSTNQGSGLDGGASDRRLAEEWSERA